MTDENTNGLPPNAIKMKAREYTKLLKAKVDANAAVTAFHNEMKTYGFDKIANWKEAYQSAIAPHGDDTLIQRIQEIVRIREAITGAPLGYQFNLIDAVEQSKDEDAAKSAKHYNNGAIAFMNCEEEDSCPHAANTPEGQDWLNGFRDMESRCKEGKKDLESYKKGMDRNAAAKNTKPVDPTKDPKDSQVGEQTPAKKKRATKTKAVTNDDEVEHIVEDVNGLTVHSTKKKTEEQPNA